MKKVILDPEKFSSEERNALMKAGPQSTILGEELPKVAAVFQDIIDELRKGNAVEVMPAQGELTTNEAAALLGVSRPFLITLLEVGKIPYRKVGTHRRVKRADILSYREKMFEDAKRAMQELMDQAQELNLGY